MRMRSLATSTLASGRNSFACAQGRETKVRDSHAGPRALGASDG
jgi:hypothetical protein